MSGKIPRGFIEDLLGRVDIVALIDKYVPLKKVGANYVARCPFHAEKTPSFSVSPGKQFYHCFGCGAGGNAISFLMGFSHLDFVEAVEDLAVWAGVAVPRDTASHDFVSGQAESGVSPAALYLANEKAARFYAEQLAADPSAEPARDYLQKRGLAGDPAVQSFMLGYAPPDWQGLEGIAEPRILLASGLTVKSEKGRPYSRFRGRLMFPIRDKRGRVIGFGGRVLDDSLPKYMNSPESPIFHKGKEVYGLFELLQKRAKPARILLVEGYMDVIALAQFGIDYAVAALGTAAGQAHLELLFRFAPEVVFCFDGDAAGRGAAWRAVTAALPVLKDGRQVRIMLLREGHDPDSLLRSEGVAAFIEQLENARALSDYFFEHLYANLNLAEIEGRSQLKNEGSAYLKQLPIGSFRDMMFEELSRLSKSPVADDEAAKAYRRPKKPAGKQSRLSLPSLIMAMLVQSPQLIEIAELKEIDWHCLDFEGVDKFTAMMAFIMDAKPATHGLLREMYRGREDEALVKKLATVELLIPENGLKQEFSDALDKLIAQSRLTVLERLLAKEKQAGLADDEKELLRKILSKK